MVSRETPPAPCRSEGARAQESAVVPVAQESATSPLNPLLGLIATFRVVACPAPTLVESGADKEKSGCLDDASGSSKEPRLGPNPAWPR